MGNLGSSFLEPPISMRRNDFRGPYFVQQSWIHVQKKQGPFGIHDRNLPGAYWANFTGYPSLRIPLTQNPRQGLPSSWWYAPRLTANTT